MGPGGSTTLWSPEDNAGIDRAVLLAQAQFPRLDLWGLLYVSVSFDARSLASTWSDDLIGSLGGLTALVALFYGPLFLILIPKTGIKPNG